MIATTQDQSQRLLRCGVSAESADMIGVEPNYGYECEPWSLMRGQDTRGYFPAWSLGALFGLLPKEIYEEETGDSYFFSLAKEFPLSEEYGAAYIPCWDKGDAIVRKRDNNPIEACVHLIEWLKENNYKLNEQ